MFQQTAAEAGVLYYPSFYQALGGRLSDVPPKYLQWDRAHPTAEAVRIIVNDLGPMVLELIEGTNAAKEAN